MKALIAGTGLAIMLLMPTGALAQQTQQTTDDQQSFKNNVQAEPATKKRQDIIRSETGQPAEEKDKATVGAGPKNKQ